MPVRYLIATIVLVFCAGCGPERPRNAVVHSKSLGDGSQVIEVWTDITRYEKSGAYLTIHGTLERVDHQSWTFDRQGREVLEWRSVIYKDRRDPANDIPITNPKAVDPESGRDWYRDQKQTYAPGSVIALRENLGPGELDFYRKNVPAMLKALAEGR